MRTCLYSRVSLLKLDARDTIFDITFGIPPRFHFYQPVRFDGGLSQKVGAREYLFLVVFDGTDRHRPSI